MLAGFHRRDITPRQPCFLAGYPHVGRVSDGVNDPLYASALCLEDGGEAVILVSLDLLLVSSPWVARCRAEIAHRTGVSAERVMIAATHTHSGPLTVELLAWRDDPAVPPVDEAYVEFVLHETAEAGVRAWESRVSCRIAWTSADVRGLAGGNRGDPRGPEDPEAGLLMVRTSADAAPLAVLVVYGMHPTVLHADSRKVSSDFIAYARAALEEAFPGAGVVYLNGVCGNQSPRRVAREKTFAEAERIGRGLGAAWIEALRALSPEADEAGLHLLVDQVDLAWKPVPSVRDAETFLAVARGRYEQLKRVQGDPAELRTAECAVFGAEEVRTFARAQADGEFARLREHYRSAEIQVLRIGERVLAAWPGEFFVEYGLEAKALAGAPLHIATLAKGDLHCYIVTPEAEAAGGYEAQMGLFAACNGARFVETTLERIRHLP